MTLISFNPATGEEIWRGEAASTRQIDQAVRKSRQAFEAWARTPREQRINTVRSWGEMLERNRRTLANLIMEETGKAIWDAESEVTAMLGKTELSIKALEERTGTKEQVLAGNRLLVRHRPHGVMVVLGPYNFPGHLPNGHIVPALLAGNSVVFKPSEYTPAVAEMMHDIWNQAGLPQNVLQIVHGGVEQAVRLVDHKETNGILFTGGEKAGRSIHRQLAGKPEKLLALELGGNAPLVVWNPRDLDEAADLVVKSAFTSSGQRCTCARRLIIPSGADGEKLITAVVQEAERLTIGRPEDSQSFMGSLISPAAASTVMHAQESLLRAGGTAILPVKQVPLGPAFLSPGIIDVTMVKNRPDEEVFGPLLQVVRVPDFEAAIEEANSTRFGLAAGLISGQRSLFEIFSDRVHAGIINFNTQTVGASGAAPFGGVGASGNHRPAGFYAADYSARPTASLINDRS